MTVLNRRSFKKTYPVILILSIFIFSSCSGKTPADRNIVVEINNYKVTLSEFNDLFSASGLEDTPENRRKFLDNLITRKLLIQEAIRQGLDKEDDFLKLIETFWSQALVQTAIQRKVMEDPGDIEVSNKELQDLYLKWSQSNPDQVRSFEDMKDFIKWQVIKNRQKEVLDSWVDELQENSVIKVKGKAIGIE